MRPLKEYLLGQGFEDDEDMEEYVNAPPTEFSQRILYFALVAILATIAWQVS